MKDAIVMQSGILVAAVLAGAPALIPRETVAPEPVVGAPVPPLTVEDRAIELACQRYGTGACSFEVFSTDVHGDRQAVFVRRSTGVCGGCGALTVAVMFRNDEVELVEKLGVYGRFGNGPDSISVLAVVGHLVIALDETISMGGYTDTYRHYFAVEGGHLDHELCLHLAGSDAGAHEVSSEWRQRVWLADEGTMYFVPESSQQRGAEPQTGAFAFPFRDGRWASYGNDSGCVEPVREAWKRAAAR